MPGFRGRGGSRGGRGFRGGGRGTFRGGRGGSSSSRGNGKLARSGIRTRNGYKKFDSQRTRELDGSGDEAAPVDEESDVEESDLGDLDISDDDDGDEEEEQQPTVRAYNALLQSFQSQADSGEHRAKRRKVEQDDRPAELEESEEAGEGAGDEVEMDLLEDGGDDDEDEEVDAAAAADEAGDDPYDQHFGQADEAELAARIKAAETNAWQIEKTPIDASTTYHFSRVGSDSASSQSRYQTGDVSKLPLKERLRKSAQAELHINTPFEKKVASTIFNYTDLLVTNRTTRNAESLRSLACLHALNHVLKGRDRVLKNNERLNHASDSESLEFRDQGFVRPKVLILLETRQMASRYASSLAQFFQPDQQENRKRFDDSFTAPIDPRDTMPEDYRELFSGNNDNSFLTALKFTRKTLKFYSAFYNSDIILASPLGLRRIIENEDRKKADHDFLSSIEIAIIDQADAMQMQSWDNVDVVFKHLNLQLTQSHNCDFSRVRSFYLDGHAKYLRQTLLFTSYLTPEINALYNSHFLNLISGKSRITQSYPGAILSTTGSGIKQIFSRFDSPSPSTDPDARFKFFTSAILPTLLRNLPRSTSTDTAPGIMIYIPSYFDFLRLRNYFATSVATENIAFGAIHDYSDVSAQRRARSHFLSGRHSVLLYTQRAHHFFRLKIRGVKKVVMYGVPDNEVFYTELVSGYLGGSVADGGVTERETQAKVLFSRWDTMKLERVVGTERVKQMVKGQGDMFEFV